MRRLRGHACRVFCVCALRGGRVVSASGDKTLRVWSAATGKCLWVLKGHSSRVLSVCTLLDGRVVSASDDMTLRLWDAGTGACLRVLPVENHKWWPKLCALGDGRVVGVSYGQSLTVWGAATKVVVGELQGHSGGLYCMCVLEDAEE